MSCSMAVVMLVWPSGRRFVQRGGTAG
jgi:hypothetical protein